MVLFIPIFGEPGRDLTVGALLSGPAKGYLCVALASVLWASSGTIGKGLFREGMTPFELVQIRVTLSCVLLLTALLEPVAGGVLAFPLLGKVLQPLQLMGGALVIGAIALLQLGREHDMVTPEIIRARRAADAADGHTPWKG